MFSRSELPSQINRKKFIKALKHLGFEVSVKGGKGSHYKATCVRTQKSITIQYNLTKNVLYYLLKEIEKINGITWDDIKKEL